MSVMGLKENWIGVWVRWVVSILFCFLENITLQSPLAFYWRYVNVYPKSWMKSSSTVCRRRRRDRRLCRWWKPMLCWRMRRSLSAEDRSHDESLQHCIARLSYAVLSSLPGGTNKRCHVMCITKCYGKYRRQCTNMWRFNASQSVTFTLQTTVGSATTTRLAPPGGL